MVADRSKWCFSKTVKPSVVHISAAGKGTADELAGVVLGTFK